METTQRDKVEEDLINNFQGLVRPLTINDIKIISKFKDGSFGFSFLGIMLYANGYNLRGKSSKYPKGLLYYDGDNIFGIGFYKKDFREKNGHLHLIAPRGKKWFKIVDDFIKQARQIPEIPKTSIYIRHLSEKQYQQLISNGYLPIANDPWHPLAHSEDETYCHRLINLDDIITYDSKGNLAIKTLKGEENRDFRRKSKMSYNRFCNFLNRNKMRFSIKPYRFDKQKNEARDIIEDHFKILRGAVGSTAEDYFNLIYFLPLDQDKKEFLGYMGYLQTQDNNIPIMIFIGEKINLDIFALYATFAVRNKKTIPQQYTLKGFSALSQYCYLRAFDILKKTGINYVDLGGSETENLDRFKRQLGAKEIKTYWAVAP